MMISFYNAKTKEKISDLDHLITFEEKPRAGMTYIKEFIIKNDNQYEPVDINPIVQSYDWAKGEYSSAPDPDITLTAPKSIPSGKAHEALLTFSPKTDRNQSLKLKIIWDTEVG